MTSALARRIRAVRENGTYVLEERLDRSKGITDVEDGQSASGACLAAFLPSDSTLPRLRPRAGMGIETQHAGRNETAIRNRPREGVDGRCEEGAAYQRGKGRKPGSRFIRFGAVFAFAIDDDVYSLNADSITCLGLIEH